MVFGYWIIWELVNFVLYIGYLWLGCYIVFDKFLYVGVNVIVQIVEGIVQYYGVWQDVDCFVVVYLGDVDYCGILW